MARVRTGVLKAVVGLMAVGLAAYIVGPPLYWHLMEALASASAPPSCPACNCDCDSMPLISIPQGLGNASFSGCTRNDPDVNEDTQKNFSELLSEELKLREAEALENQRRADMALLEAKKMTSQYQKEADKCNSGMETCEEAREKSETALSAQKQLTALWMQRARQRGWTQGEGNVRRVQSS
ncbi:uncharacterized protein LOC127266145 [Andrographis paniculata]|uniref:uncharacterized protein LOC127266145 n=1 Tax=Andrographis paniculata TaxID=175694 RepID=UPI0021E6DE8B|nr:uncharacterized protein LOC127266145 [Andrographis paniculata]